VSVAVVFSLVARCSRSVGCKGALLPLSTPKTTQDALVTAAPLHRSI
jgi:hypothetical protein